MKLIWITVGEDYVLLLSLTPVVPCYAERRRCCCMIFKFNIKVSIKPPKYRQRVECPARGFRTVWKWSAKLDNSYKSYRLPPQQIKPVVLLPSYNPISRIGGVQLITLGWGAGHISISLNLPLLRRIVCWKNVHQTCEYIRNTITWSHDCMITWSHDQSIYRED